MEILNIQRIIQLGDQVLDVRNFLQLLTAQGLELGRGDVVHVVVDIDGEILN